METINLDLAKSNQDLLNTSTAPYENYSYGLENVLSTNNNQEAIQHEQILFIDSTVRDYQKLINNLAQPTEVIVLDSQRDGIVQITESLQQYDDLNAIHIVSHGDIGELSLGNSKLNQNTLNNYADDLINWGNSIGDRGDILLYGCNVGGDISGAKFVENLAQYTTADILASTDLTGSTHLGGDWDLEFAVGDINTNLAFKAEITQDYQYVLNDFFNNIPIFDNGTVFESFPPDVVLPGSDLPSAPIRLELNQTFGAPNIELNPPFLFDPSIVINNSDFRVDYVPFDFNFIGNSSNSNGSTVNFTQAENQPFSLNFINGDSFFRPSSNYNYDNAFINSLIFPFDASSLNFNPTNFEFTSVSLNEINPLDPDFDSITFKFDEGSFDFSSLTSNKLLAFEFSERVANASNLEYNNLVQLTNNFSFEATAVTFRADSITFDFKPKTLNFDPGAFAANANLYDYKLSAADFNAGVTVEQFNASDYRALNYAFAGDELFDSAYYSGSNDISENMNPFADYIENGYRAGRDPHPLFGVNYYFNNNPDVRDSGSEPLQHYVNQGFKEGRDPHGLFDTSYYNETNPDVAAAGVNPLLHYVTFGNSENVSSRDPNRIFDNSYYNQMNPDVAASGMSALEHYWLFGWRESLPENNNPNVLRDPNPFFSSSDYLEIHDDVRLATYDLPSANPVQHSLEFGNNGTVLQENRITHKIFQSENIAKVTRRITPDSDPQEILAAQKEFNKANLDLSIREDGTFEVSQIRAIDDIVNPYTAAAVVLTVLVGGAILFRDITNDGDLDFDWEFNFDGSSDDSDLSIISGYTVVPENSISDSVVNINFRDPSLEDLLSGTRAFPGQTESERRVDIFIPPAVEGVEDYTIFPEDGIFLPSTTGFPRGDALLEDLLNNGLFLGGEETAEGSYVLASGVTVIGTPDVPEELPQSIRLGQLEGGGTIRFLGGNSQGIEGFFTPTGTTEEKPFSLKSFNQVGKLRNTIRRINDNATQIQNAGITDPVLLRIEINQFSVEEIKNFVDNGPIKNFPSEGIFEKIYFDAADGTVLVDSTGTFIIN